MLWLEHLLDDPVWAPVVGGFSLLLFCAVVRWASPWWTVGAIVWTMANACCGGDIPTGRCVAGYSGIALALALNVLVWPFALCALIAIWCYGRLGL